MKVKDILRTGRVLITDPKHWTQGSYAKDRNGQTVSIDNPEAVCFCSDGALSKVVERLDSTYYAAYEALGDAAYGPTRHYGIISYNDAYGRTHAEVLAVWDKAIAEAKE